MKGQSAHIVDISGDDKTVNRLAEMGIRIGERVKIKEPGCPLRMTVAGHDVLLRCEQSLLILVQSEPVAAIA